MVRCSMTRMVLILAVLAVPSVASAQLCRGNAFPDQSLTAIQVGIANAPEVTIPILGLDMAVEYDPLAFLPLERSLSGTIYTGTNDALGVITRYAFAIPTPSANLGVCVTPSLALGMHAFGDTDAYGFEDSRDVMGLGLEANLGYATRYDDLAVVPFATIGALGDALSFDETDDDSGSFFGFGANAYLRNGLMVGGQLVFNDPMFGGGTRAVAQAGINF